MRVLLLAARCHQRVLCGMPVLFGLARVVDFGIFADFRFFAPGRVEGVLRLFAFFGSDWAEPPFAPIFIFLLFGAIGAFQEFGKFLRLLFGLAVVEDVAQPGAATDAKPALEHTGS